MEATRPVGIETLESKNIAQWIGCFEEHSEPLPVVIHGWVRSIRGQKERAFMQLNDGSHMAGIQVVLDLASNTELAEQLAQCATGSCVVVEGELCASPAKGQSCEVQGRSLTLLGAAPSDYPLQKKRHNFEFLRTIAHLRTRSNTLGAVTRLRDQLARALHETLGSWGFLQVHTPVLTTLDCEGAGEMFRLAPIEKEEFFGEPTFLTVSGQLHAEVMAMSHKRVYTFGPTFRAENSHTSRHLAEFWMLEPEMAFFDLEQTIHLASTFLKRVVTLALERCRADLAFFDQHVAQGLLDNLERFASSKTEYMTYSEAIAILSKAPKEFIYPVSWGIDLQSEHERYLCEEYVGMPLAITDYPKEIKAFYMRENDDGKTVAAMDFLVPGVGEIIGGSQREERLDYLEAAMARCQIPPLPWYSDLRRYGGVVHSGFGLGFERLIQWMTGLDNIRETSLFPRSAGSAIF